MTGVAPDRPGNGSFQVSWPGINEQPPTNVAACNNANPPRFGNVCVSVTPDAAFEETGWYVALGRPLPSTTYTVVDRTGRLAIKQVRYWAMTPTGGTFTPTAEVDEVRWLGLDAARSLLTYERDWPVLDALDREV